LSSAFQKELNADDADFQTLMARIFSFTYHLRLSALLASMSSAFQKELNADDAYFQTLMTRIFLLLIICVHQRCLLPCQSRSKKE